VNLPGQIGPGLNGIADGGGKPDQGGLTGGDQTAQEEKGETVEGGVLMIQQSEGWGKKKGCGPPQKGGVK